MKKLPNLIYAIFGGVTVAVFAAMIIWSSLGVKEGEVRIYAATVVCEEGTSTEYLVGQSFNAEGVSLNIGSASHPKTVDAADCTIDADFSSSGNKRVAVNYSPNDYTSYIGYLDVTVYFVRGLKVINEPTEIAVGDDGSFSCDENFKIAAYLSAAPKNTAVFPPQADGSVLLTPDAYTAQAVESKQIPGYYTASIYCGNLTYSFDFYNDAGKTFLIKAERSVVALENADPASDSALTLIVTDAPDTYQHQGAGKTEGYYVYTKSGEQSVHAFSYELTETSELFKSAGVSESHDGGAYTVVCGGETFTAAADVWQSAVVNGTIVKDGDFLFVVESEQRTAEFTRITESAVGGGEQTPTLKVYITYYEFNMSTGSGLATGFYVYTHRDGVKYKLPFWFQTWVWDRVPLSSDHRDGKYANCYVDLDWMYPQYYGPVTTRIKINGQEETFQVDFAEIVYAAYNTN